jgi:SAM-dependent methyltransferase
MKFTTKVAYLIFPSYVWSILIWESKFTWYRWINQWWPCRRRFIKQLKHRRNLKIHLGCSACIFSDWMNVDGFAQDGIDLQWDLRYPLPLSASSTRMIYTEHLLEHLFKDDAIKLLEQCYRILEPGGIIRIGVPDAELYLRAYAEGRNEFFKRLEHLGGAVKSLSTPIDVINQVFRMGGHHLFAWDFLALSLSLESVGFIDIKRWEPGKASRSEICLDNPDHAFETLYVEASKPSM